MDFESYERHLFELWSSVRIERSSRYSLFTFGETELPYYLVKEPPGRTDLVSLSQGMIRITRPSIILPGAISPEFRNFFTEQEEDGEALVQFLLSRSAAFANLKFDNSTRTSELVSDSSDEIVDKLNQKLDREEEEGTAILAAPEELGWMALMRYASERVMASTPDNVQELRERGFLDFD
jgi:hypothetical protein